MAVLAGVLLLSGCVTEGTAQPAPTGDVIRSMPSTPPGIRQTDDNGVKLPFTTTFPRRWNSGNDGTAYEPCNGASPEALKDSGLDVSSAEDAAAADFQTARGCVWKYKEHEYATLSQTVGNADGLNAYKEQYSVSVRWQGETSLGGRRVAIGGAPGGKTCETFVASGSAIVITSAYFPASAPPIDEICDKAIAFTRATIDQMPR